MELYDGGYDGATVVSVSPAGNAVSVVRSSDVSAVFPEAVDAATVTGSSFDVDEAGTTETISAALSYDAGSKTATLNPDVDLDAGAGYTATVKGGHERDQGYGW